LVAVLQHGIRNTEFDSAANFALGIFSLAFSIFGELADASTTFTGIKLDAAQGVSIDTHANGTLSEAGFVHQANAQAEFLTVTVALIRGIIGSGVCAVLVVTVVIQGTVEDVEAAVFDKAIGLGLAGRPMSST
jgi:hypothetical protein